MLKIAQFAFTSPLVLAPLAGYSDLPFRLLCREFGAGLCFSEMISCHGLGYGQKKTLAMLISAPEEKPVSFQLFGADVKMMAKAADLINHFSPDLVDINMGCPVKKVTKKGAGAALMATPKIAEEIIREVRKNCHSPITVKFRKGVNNQSITCVDFAKMTEQNGASAITVHGRTWSQGFTGQADWSVIRQVKENVSIPVIGNGDILSYEEASKRLAQSGCDGVMIGRGALGNPWVFDAKGRPQDYTSLLLAVTRHLDLMRIHLDTDRLLGVVKNHIGRYFKHLKGSSNIRREVYAAESFKDLYRKIVELQSKSMD